jgi:hypothetical protein
MQFTRRDWRNRNQIKTPQGLQWLTVPVQVKGKYDQKIKDTLIDGSAWATSHWKTLEQNYRRAVHFEEVAQLLQPLYIANSYTHISHLNQLFIEKICNYLGIKTIISNSRDYNLIEGKTERLADLCKQVSAEEYISGPSAKDYVDENVFTEMNIKLTWFDYSGYPEYSQLWGDFIHGVSILDMLFNCGKDTPKYLRCLQS